MNKTPVIGRFEVRGAKEHGEPLLGSFSYTAVPGSYETASEAAENRKAALRTEKKMRAVAIVHISESA